LKENTEASADQYFCAHPSKDIRLPIEEAEYEGLITDKKRFRAFIDEQFRKHPELFPVDMSLGYHLHVICRSYQDE
jgi:hypothetical protein